MLLSRMAHLVDVQICGIPEHAWFRSTVEAILEDSCHIVEVHSDTLLKKELSSFVVQAWCFDFKKLQGQMTLRIIEKGLQSNKRGCLSYNVSVSATLVNTADADLGGGGVASLVSGGRSSARGFDYHENGDRRDPRPRRSGAPPDGRSISGWDHSRHKGEDESRMPPGSQTRFPLPPWRHS
jgi:hypothetical protein